MALLMGFHISFCHEPLAARPTFKCLVLLVDVDMRLQICLLREAFTAVIGAQIWLGSQVKLEMAF